MGGGPPGFPASSSCSPVLWILSPARSFRLRDYHPLWSGFPTNSANLSQWIIQSATPTVLLQSVWPLSISLAATLEIDFSFFSSGYLDVSVHRVPFHTLWIGVWTHEGFSCRFPHSEIHGSMVICTSPWLFAAYHVFLRLLVPRHPPCALISLTK